MHIAATKIVGSRTTRRGVLVSEIIRHLLVVLRIRTVEQAPLSASTRPSRRLHQRWRQARVTATRAGRSGCACRSSPAEGLPYRSVTVHNHTTRFGPLARVRRGLDHRAPLGGLRVLGRTTTRRGIRNRSLSRKARPGIRRLGGSAARLCDVPSAVVALREGTRQGSRHTLDPEGALPRSRVRKSSVVANARTAFRDRGRDARRTIRTDQDLRRSVSPAFLRRRDYRWRGFLRRCPVRFRKRAAPSRSGLIKGARAIGSAGGGRA